MVDIYFAKIIIKKINIKLFPHIKFFMEINIKNKQFWKAKDVAKIKLIATIWKEKHMATYCS